MGDLKAIFDKLDNSEYCRFSEEGIYSIEEKNQVIELKPKELLEIGRTYPSREHVMIAYFGEDSTRVAYFGENQTEMLKTLQKLKIPKSPSNLGEIVLKQFKQHLEDSESNQNPLSVELKVYSGNEHQFLTVIKKLIHVYSGNEIDSDFYAAT